VSTRAATEAHEPETEEDAAATEAEEEEEGAEGTCAKGRRDRATCTSPCSGISCRREAGTLEAGRWASKSARTDGANPRFAPEAGAPAGEADGALEKGPEPNTDPEGSATNRAPPPSGCPTAGACVPPPHSRDVVGWLAKGVEVEVEVEVGVGVVAVPVEEVAAVAGGCCPKCACCKWSGWCV
jgi:hypothetical protein